jgi:hypothetical protein
LPKYGFATVSAVRQARGRVKAVFTAACVDGVFERAQILAPQAKAVFAPNLGRLHRVPRLFIGEQTYVATFDRLC